ncbi:MAG: MarR family winged helix-turn-helix transcriptional regulator [Nakamurella sp.]
MPATSETAISTTTAPIDIDVLFLINQAGFALNAEMSGALGDIGISPREFCVLSHALKGDLTQIQLAELSALDKTTMVVTLDKLEKAGLAERRLSSTDRRARIVAVTTAGRRAVSRAQSVVAEMYADILGALPKQDREVFLRSLIALVGGRLAQPSHVERPVRRRSPTS